MASGEEIQRALRGFVSTWGDYTGSEKAEAQTFLNQLFACYGTDRLASGAQFEFYIPLTGGFMDLHWPEVCLIEMKAPGVAVATAQQQVERYWRATSDLATGRKAARFIVICNFRQLEIWEYGVYPDTPVASFDLADLPDRYDALAFLAGPTIEPNFVEHHRELTQEAARAVAGVFASLAERSAAPLDEIQRFVLQSVWCMFAEDLGLLDGYPLQATLNAVRSDPPRSLAELGLLFRVLDQKTDRNRRGRLAGTTYVNGELFSNADAIELDRDEIDLMLTATGFDWRKVNPTIFGSLLEGVLGKERRWEIGAHYTHEVDIMKIVGPTIVRAWRERIDEAATPAALAVVLDELCTFRVLDPACGCGNFLYVAYRELRALEHEIKQRLPRLARETGLPVPTGRLPYYPLSNLQGIDIERSAVEIAKVTLWMGHRQMIDLYGEAEPPLPLQSLPGLQQGDALRLPWPETDCIIGNPPFNGASHLRSNLGDDYVEWLKHEFGVGIKDLCTYWFRRAADHLRPGQRAGLVGTNSISQNLGRSASLDFVMARGGVITDAVSSQKWPGDAKVHVSIVNWVDNPSRDPFAVLDGVPIDRISASLRAAGLDWTPKPLDENAGRCFEGPSPKAKGLIISRDEARALLNATDANYADVVRPYLTASDITNSPTQAPSRWAIDFGLRTLEQATRYPAALRIVRQRVKPERESNRRRSYREKWWIFAEPRTAMRSALAELDRHVVMARHGKRAIYTWAEPRVLASDATKVFTFPDDYAMGILTSVSHGAWAWDRSGTLKADLRYTNTTTFMTFPWPDPVTDGQRERVAEASRRLLARRSEICATEQIGLTTLYNAVDEGAWADLKALHRELDEAVADCYGWPRAVAQDDREIVRRLTDLNREISEGRRSYAPFDTIA